MCKFAEQHNPLVRSNARRGLVHLEFPTIVSNSCHEPWSESLNVHSLRYLCHKMCQICPTKRCTFQKRTKEGTVLLVAVILSVIQAMVNENRPQLRAVSCVSLSIRYCQHERFRTIQVQIKNLLGVFFSPLSEAFNDVSQLNCKVIRILDHVRL